MLISYAICRFFLMFLSCEISELYIEDALVVEKTALFSLLDIDLEAGDQGA